MAKTISYRIFGANTNNYTEETRETKSMEELKKLQQKFLIMESLKEIESPNVDKFQTLVKELKIFKANGKLSSNFQNFFGCTSDHLIKL